MADTDNGRFRVPMNVFVYPGSRAERAFRMLSGTPIPEAIAPGFQPAPEHDLKYQGGRTIRNLSFANFYIGADGWNTNDIKNIDTCLAAAMSDQDLNNVMEQYFAPPITTAFLGSLNLPGPPPQIVSQGDTEQWVTAVYNQGVLKGLDLTSTVFNFILPRGTVLNTDTRNTTQSLVGRMVWRPTVERDDDSLNGLGGYHGSVHVSASDVVYYAVGVYSESDANGKVNGIPVFDQPWKNVVATFYHELNEVRTDPDVEDSIHAGSDPKANALLGWISDQGEECGDFPVAAASNDLSSVFREVPVTDGTFNVPIQFQYSNAVHGPEGPIAEAHSQGMIVQRRTPNWFVRDAVPVVQGLAPIARQSGFEVALYGDVLERGSGTDLDVMLVAAKGRMSDTAKCIANLKGLSEIARCGELQELRDEIRCLIALRDGRHIFCHFRASTKPTQ